MTIIIAVDHVPKRKPLLSGLELIVCAAVGILFGLASTASHPGGGVAGVVGNIVGSSLAILLLFLAGKVLWRLALFIFTRAKRK